MLPFVRKAEFRKNGASLNFNIAYLTGQSDSAQNTYLGVVKQKFPPTPGVAPWTRQTRYGITFLAPGKPNWNTDSTRYWANMYYRAAGSDVMSSRKLMFEPILWIRQVYGQQFMCRTNGAPHFFGRDNSTDVQAIADGSNQWRSDIRAQLETFITENIGSTGGEPWLTQVKYTNMNVEMVIGPNEIDRWENTRLYYVDDAECSGGQAPDEATRAGVANLAGTGGLNRLLLRIRDHQRHIFEYCREVRPDVGVVAPSIIETDKTPGTREFTVYEFLAFANAGSGLTAQGNINDVCDAHQLHNHQSQWIIPDFWAGSTSVPDGSISGYHYWNANAQVQAWRVANALPNNTRPLLATEVGVNYYEEGVVTAGRTDLHQLRSLRYGLLALGPLFWGCTMVHFYSVGLSPQDGMNLIENNVYFTDTQGKADADYVAKIMDWRETTDDIPFVAKGWQEFADPTTWAVGCVQQQNPIDGGPTVCPFVEWNRVSMGGAVVTMSAGGRNVLVRKKNLRRGLHTFKVDVKLDNASSRACISVHGYDKLDGLAVSRSTILIGVNDWTTLSVNFTPRQHGNPRIPDTPICVLMIDHNGTGVCQVRNPSILMPGTSTIPPVPDFYNFRINSVTWTPANPGPGSAVVFSASITNIGNTVTPGGIINGVRFRVDGINQTYCDNNTSGFAVGETRTLTANNSYVTPGTNTWVATTGTHTVDATFDDVNRFPEESDKTDNSISSVLTVAAEDQYFDFTIDDVQWTPAAPTSGQLVRFGAIVRNTGTIASPGSIVHGVRFSVDGVQVSFSDNQTASIPAGGTRLQWANGPTANGGQWAATAGSHSIDAWVDDVNRFASERDKTNNHLIESFTVTGTSPAPTERFLGVFVNDTEMGGGAPWSPAVIDTWQTVTGPSKVRVWHWYIPIGYPWFATELAAIDSRGYVPLLSIASSTAVDPWPETSWSNIAAGQQDASIDNLATIINNFGKTVVLQYDWEMNIKPQLGNAAQFIAAHQHVVNRVRAITSFAKFHWCPAAPPGNPDPTPYWPGDAYVDYPGYNSYNWGDRFEVGAWATPQEVYGQGYAICMALSAKPIWIGETGCAGTPGDKPAWLTDAFLNVIPNQYPNIQCVAYYHDIDPSGVDWRITKPTAASATAWKAIQSSPIWSGASPIAILPPMHVSTYELQWNDEFEGMINCRHPTQTGSLGDVTWSPSGRWWLGLWGDDVSNGCIQPGADRCVAVNPTSTNAALAPYRPIVKLDSTTMRLIARRSHCDTRPALNSVLNDIVANAWTPGSPDYISHVNQIWWLGAYIRADNPADKLMRPVYTECRMRASPRIDGYGGAFWLYDIAISNSLEIDIVDMTGSLASWGWETNLHDPAGSGTFKVVHSDIAHRLDDTFHVYGLWWTSTFIRLYRDNALLNEWTGLAVTRYVNPMYHILSFAGQGSTDPFTFEEVYFDIDWIRVWRPSGSTPIIISPSLGIIRASGIAPAISRGLTPSPAAVAVIGLTPILYGLTALAPQTGAISAAGVAPTMQIGLGASLAPVVADGLSPSIYTIPTFFVDKDHPSASDSNPGTEASPWLTIQKAATTLTAGQRAYIKSGTYTGNVLVSNSGTAGNLINFSAYPGHEHAAIIDGGTFVIDGKSYIRVHGLRIQNSDCGVYVKGPSTGVIVSGNYTYNTTDSGISCWGVPWMSDPGDWLNILDIIIEDNIVEMGATVSNEMITLCNGIAGFEIRRNIVFHGTPSEGAGIGIDAKGGCINGKIWGNECYDLLRTAIYVDGGFAPITVPDNHHIDIYNNIVHDSTEGIVVLTEGEGTVHDVNVYNNITWNNRMHGLMLYNHPVGTGAVNAITFINNTVYNCATDQVTPYWAGLRIAHEFATNVTVRNNIVYSNPNWDIDYISYGAGFVEDHNMDTNPNFVNVATNDFHLQVGSNAIDTGSATLAPDEDFDGVSRPQGSGVDIGAYEQ